MKAAIHTRYGGPDVIEVVDFPKPKPNNDQILIRTYFSTVNRTDRGFRSAEYVISRLFSGIFKPKNPILGNEFAGIVEEVGSNVTSFKVGDRVFGYNDTTFGAHAEYMVVQENSPVLVMPDGLTFEQAAPIVEGAHYALCDIRAMKIKKGDKVLVNGATGAIGSAAVQLLRYFGAEVTAVCGTNHLSQVKAFGAVKVIDYMKEDFTQLNEQFDVVFDAVGKSTFAKCKPILKNNGVYISTELGPHLQNPFFALIAPFTKGKKVLFPLPTITKDDVAFLLDLVQKGVFTPLVDKTYSLDAIRSAHEHVETGMKIGNVLIKIV